jgi:hypothetical protein
VNTAYLMKIFIDYSHPLYKGIGKAIPVQYWTGNPCTVLDRPCSFQEVEASRFQGIRCMKVVRLSVPSTGRLYLPENIPGPVGARGDAIG